MQDGRTAIVLAMEKGQNEIIHSWMIGCTYVNHEVNIYSVQSKILTCTCSTCDCEGHSCTLMNSECYVLHM